MPHALDSFRVKINRAHSYLETLQREVESWRARKPYEIFSEYEPGPQAYYVFRLRFFEGIPLEWGLLVGDFAHNARSALDHLAFQLVTAGGGTPDRSTQFPVLVNPFEWEGRQGKERLTGAAPRHIAIVEALQPYHRRDTFGYFGPWAAMRDPLAVLAFLNNEDKHRVLHGTPVALTRIGYDFIPTRDIASFDLSKSRTELGPLKDGDELVRVPIVPSGPEPEAKLDHAETADVTFDQRLEHAAGGFIRERVTLIPELEAIEAKLWHIFEVFVNEFR